MKVYCTVTMINSQHQFEFATDVNPDLPWSEFIKAIGLHKMLDQKYPDWQGYDLDIDPELIIPQPKLGIIKPDWEEE